MKRLLLLFLIILYSSISKGQTDYFSFSDKTIGSEYVLKSGIDYSAYIPNATTPMKYIRVNFHFMQKTNGIGNFSETSDGITTNSLYTGYYFAKKIIELVRLHHMIDRVILQSFDDRTLLAAKKIELLKHGVPEKKSGGRR